MSDLAMTAERALLNLFTDLHRAGLPDVATTLSELCDRVLDTTTATTGQHLAIVQMLRDAHPDHATMIMSLAIGKAV